MAISDDLRPRSRPAATWLMVGLATVGVLAALAGGPAAGASEEASPLFGVVIPQGYRAWPMVGVSHETEPLNELRGILANARAIEAYKTGTLPFPDGPCW